jgi:hypothetical protein
MENAELVDSVGGACGERGFVHRCSCLGQIPSDCALLGVFIFLYIGFALGQIHGACALLRVFIFLYSGFALALVWVLDDAVFGSYSCPEGQFPKVFPFTLIKSVDCSADLRVTSSVRKQQLREDASEVTENVYLVRRGKSHT